MRNGSRFNYRPYVEEDGDREDGIEVSVEVTVEDVF